MERDVSSVHARLRGAFLTTNVTEQRWSQETPSSGNAIKIVYITEVLGWNSVASQSKCKRRDPRIEFSSVCYSY